MEDYEKILEGITNDEDNAYNIIKKNEEKKIRNVLYKSIHDPNLLPSYSTFNIKGKRYNITNVTGLEVKKEEKKINIIHLKNDHNNKKILKKGEKNKTVASLSEIKKTNPNLFTVKIKKKKFKCPLPDRNEAPLIKVRDEKVDYIYDNAVQVINSKPEEKKKKVGKVLLDENPLNKKDYGKISPYLIKLKDELKQKENSKKQDIIDEEKIAKEIEEKKKNILIELQNKYNEINKEYLKISHVVDVNSVRKLKKKENYEHQLSQLEKDIQKLETQRL